MIHFATALLIVTAIANGIALFMMIRADKEFRKASADLLCWYRRNLVEYMPDSPLRDRLMNDIETGVNIFERQPWPPT